MKTKQDLFTLLVKFAAELEQFDESLFKNFSVDSLKENVENMKLEVSEGLELKSYKVLKIGSSRGLLDVDADAKPVVYTAVDLIHLAQILAAENDLNKQFYEDWLGEDFKWSDLVSTVSEDSFKQDWEDEFDTEYPLKNFTASIMINEEDFADVEEIES